MTSWSVALRGAPNIAVYPPGASFGPRVAPRLGMGLDSRRPCALSLRRRRRTRRIELPPDHLLLCRPHARDEFFWSPHSRTRHGFLHFSLLDAPAPWENPAQWPRARALGQDDIAATLCRHLLTLAPGGSENDAQTQAAATLLIGAFVTGQLRIGQAAPQRLPDAVERALGFLYARLDKDGAAPIALRDLARAACVTPEHLCRVFKDATGLTPLQTVKLARLDRAAILLSRSNYGIGEVGRLSGFASPFHFSRVFKQNYGITPRELRARTEKGEATPTPLLLRTLHRQDLF